MYTIVKLKNIKGKEKNLLKKLSGRKKEQADYLQK